jgi:hypothetical protein
MAEYTAAKRRIFEHGARRLVLNGNLTDRCASESVPTSVFATSADGFSVTCGREKHSYAIPDTFLRISFENLPILFGSVP